MAREIKGGTVRVTYFGNGWSCTSRTVVDDEFDWSKFTGNISDVKFTPLPEDDEKDDPEDGA